MDNNTTYTYIGGEITFGSGVINRGFGIDSSLVRYEENTSAMEVITNLIKGVYLNSNDSHIIIKKDESDKTGVKFELNLSDILNLIETLTENLRCSPDLAKVFSRIDKLYWNAEMSLNYYTDSEQELIKFLVKERDAVQIEYFLDHACRPYLRMRCRLKNDSK